MIKEKVTDFAILKCTSQYPTNSKDINLKTIKHLKELFNCPVGLSDHTLGSAVPIWAVVLGANIIKKHFTVNKKHKTADSFFSADQSELKQIVDDSRLVYDAIGKVDYIQLFQSQVKKRSLIVTKDIKANERLQNNVNFSSLRPDVGIEPKYLYLVNNKIVKQDLKKAHYCNGI